MSGDRERDQELEHLLRRTFTDRAADVDRTPEWSGPGAPADRDPAPSRAVRVGGAGRWSAALAAAAVVVLAAVTVWVVRTGTHHPDATVHPPVATAPAVQSVCTASLPAKWQRALQSARADAGGRTATTLSIAADGSVLALRDDGVTPGSGREVVAVGPRGVRVLFPVPAPDRLTATAAYLDGATLLVGLADAPRPARGATPGSSAIGLRAVVVVDVASGWSRVLAGTTAANPAPSTPSIQALVYLDGVGYWDTEAGYGADTGALHSYDLDRGPAATPATVYQGPIGWPRADAVGVGWPAAGSTGFRFVVTRRLPAPVQQALTPFARSRVATDGTAYAWYASTSVLGWWMPGRPQPVYLRLAAPVDPETALGGPLVSGEYVVASGIVDVLTRARAPLPATGLYAPQARGGFLYSRGTLLAGLVTGRESGHLVEGYWADLPTQPLRLDLTGLPRITC